MSGAQDTATYLYGIARSAAPLSAEGAPAGLPETSPPRLVPLGGDLQLVVGDAPLPAFSGEAIERRLADLTWVSTCAVAHERVVAHFAARAPVVPLKLFTLFASDARAVAELAGRRARIEEVLERVAGCQEWGVRVHYDAAQARRAAAADPGSGDPASSARRPASGSDFLRRKKEQQEASRTLASRAGEAAEEAFAALSGAATAARRREPVAGESGPRLLLDAAFLVPVAGTAAFERAVQAAAERLAANACEVNLTGPWPPYNFIEEVG
jgi:gas vesicle protein GvpL/GvpF